MSNESVNAPPSKNSNSTPEQIAKQLQRQLDFERLISDISARFINLPADRIEAAILESLQQFGEFFEVSRVVLNEFRREPSPQWRTRAWHSSEYAAHHTDVPEHSTLKPTPAFVELIRTQKILVVEDTKKLPAADALTINKMVSNLYLQSGIVICLDIGDHFFGYLALGSTRAPRPELTVVTDRLRFTGEIFANALYRKRSQEQIHFQVKLLDSVGQAVIATDAAGAITYWNWAAERIYGWSAAEVMNKQITDVTPALKSVGQAVEIMKQVQQSHSWSGELIVQNRAGQEFPAQITNMPILNASGDIIGVIGISQDISEQKKLEQEKHLLEKQLRQAQRMESIGTLAGGIAHDFNNILVPIMGYAELAELRLPANHMVQHYLQQITAATTRAKDLVSQILTFSRLTDQERQSIQIAPIIKETIKLLRSSLPVTIEIRQNIATDCGCVMADPGQIQQMLMNLCTNAYQAMEQTGGVLSISLEQVEVDEQLAQRHVNLKPAAYVRLTVSDTGSGIEPLIQDRIFEPFFTTKATGKGTGLGLSVVHGIVKGHGGAIMVDSNNRQGTHITVYLPTINISTDESQTTLSEEQVSRGTGHILVVDDEEVVVMVTSEILTQFGYTVATFTSVTEALAAFRAQPAKFDLIITDLTMPTMDGLSFAKVIKANQPDIPILLMTGHTDQITREKIKPAGISDVLIKPIGVGTLNEAVSRAVQPGNPG